MSRVLSAVILISLLPLTDVSAQGRMTLADFLDLARGQNLDLKIAQTKIDATQGGRSSNSSSYGWRKPNESNGRQSGKRI